MMCIGGGAIRHTLDVFVVDGRIHFDDIVPIPDIAHVYGVEAWKIKYRGFTVDSAECKVQSAKDKEIYSFETDGIPRPLFMAIIERFPFGRFVLFSVSDDGGRVQLEGSNGQLTRDEEKTGGEFWT